MINSITIDGEESNMYKKVMIVDDEADILNSLKTIFKQQDFDVITVDNGVDCINELEKGFKGVILMDIMMPGMDGWQTIREIVNKGLIKNVAIGIITGKGTKDHQNIDRLRCYIYDYFSKPLNIKELIRSVEGCYIFINEIENEEILE
jgi:DNA-binding response OmpR family regulator